MGNEILGIDEQRGSSRFQPATGATVERFKSDSEAGVRSLSQDRIRRNERAIIVPGDDSEKLNEMVETLIKDVQRMCIEERCGLALHRLSTVIGLEMAFTEIHVRLAAFRYLVDEYDPGFGFVQFQQCDTVYHEFPGEEETVRRVYSAVDAEVGEIIDTCDPDVTLLVSDHGIGPMEGLEFRVNSYLRDESFLTTTAGEGGMPSWKSISRNRLRHGEVSDSVERSPVERALALAARVGITSQRIGTVLQRFGLDDHVREIVPMDIVRAGSEQVDFASSTAYMRSRTEMGVRLNVEGREPEGIIPDSEYERIREDVIESLKRATIPAGDPVFERVCPRETVFDGPYLEDAPDIVTVPDRFEHYLSASVREETFTEPNEPWEHKLEGVVMAVGDDIDPETDLSDAHLFDITPTILATFELPIDERMDGTPLPVVEPTGTAEYPSFDRDSVVMTDDSDVEQRLADLGYLE